MLKPNVIFIISDQHRWDFLGCQDGETKTPHIDALANRGVTFKKTYCTVPLCTPSRAAISCGRYPTNSGCYTNLHQIPANTPTFINQFHQAGYRTAAIGKTHTEIHAYDSDLCSNLHRQYMNTLGYDDVCEVGGNDMFMTGLRCAYSRFLEETGYLNQATKFMEHWPYFLKTESTTKVLGKHEPRTWPLPDEIHETSFIGQNAIEWIEKNVGKGQPIYAHVGFSLPHHPIVPLAHILEQYPKETDYRPVNTKDTPAWHNEAVQAYRAAITHIDQQVGRICDTLQKQGELDNTIIVFTADHGESLGDHDIFGKCNFYEGSIRVPMVVAGPGIAKGLCSDALLELIDVGATMNDLCDIKTHELDQGKSFRNVLAGKTTEHRETVFSQMGCDQMIFDGRYKLMLGEPLSDKRKLGRLWLDKPINISPSPAKLFDLQNDPNETHNLLDEPDGQLRYYKMIELLLLRINQDRQTQPAQDRGEFRPRRSTRNA